jgi:hypothetical protein
MAKHVGVTYRRSFGVLGGADEAAAKRWTQFAVPTIEATQTHVARTQLAYVRSMSAAMGLAPDAEIDPADYVGDALRDDGRSMDDRYNGPIVAVRSWLSQGLDFLGAMSKGAGEAQELSRSDVADTARAAATGAMSTTPGIVAYRRVTSENPCEFCVLIAGQTYHTDELAPAHNNCTCGVAPVTDESDPALAWQKQVSKDIYANEQAQ